MAEPNGNPGDREPSTSGQINRRRFLGYTGATGVGGLGLTTASVGATVVGDRREIVFTRDEHGPATTKEVPEAWYQQSVRSRQVRDALKERYENAPWIGSVGRRPTSEEIDGLSTYEISVGAKDVEAAKRVLPDQIDGISIDVHEFEEPVPQAWCNRHNYSCVEGGSFLGVETSEGNTSAISATCIAHNSSGYVRLMTCAHGFLDNCGHDIKYNKVYQGSDNDYVGYVTDWDRTMDWALVRESSYSEISGIDNQILGAPSYLRGWVNEDGIDYLISSDYTTYKYGAKTCESSDQLRGEEWYTRCWGWTLRGFTYLDAESGDSGAPHYIYYDGYCWLIGPHYGYDPFTGRKLMQYAYRFNDGYGITVGSTSNTC